MGYEPSGPSITSTLELKLDQSTVFEWQKHSLKSEGVPYYLDLLEFLNLRAQTTESTITDGNSKRVTHARPYAKKTSSTGGTVASHATSADSTPSQCILCKPNTPYTADCH